MESVAATDSVAAQDTASSASRTASAPPSASGSASISRQRSPVDETVSDSEPEMEAVPTQPSEQSKKEDEREVEQLLVLQRSCSIHDNRDRIEPALDTDVDMNTEEMTLQYPTTSPSAVPMDIDGEEGEPPIQGISNVSGSFVFSSPYSFLNGAQCSPLRSLMKPYQRIDSIALRLQRRERRRRMSLWSMSQ